MDLAAAGRVRVRATLLWLTVTAAQAGLVALTAPLVRALATAPGPTFADLLVQACAAAAPVAGLLLWLATTEVVRDVLRHRVSSRRAVGPVRLALLAACGVTVLATTSAPAHAGSDTPVGTGAPLSAEALAGLPLPDRPVDPRHGALATDVVTVRAGDSLWTIAERRLGPAASRADVASYWLRVRALNTDRLDPDPDLIQPGQMLRLPRN
ncbi:LysM peptidoglycan-binding domain-containing protein [Nocardioides sp. SLBN-35]|uniref:LysM peptidoglycan-binding domain-containing protein n=1 Tax=Nocardioides sp. SLBN-35 TaxID=2768445 RepID=UPI00114F70E1|nr:LysM domain-containing protein [Nocardioides sp. SLBN-35]TQK70127.1 LysM domain-containing protein [Nocardioides sp. SLBN-35]